MSDALTDEECDAIRRRVQNSYFGVRNPPRLEVPSLFLAAERAAIQEGYKAGYSAGQKAGGAAAAWLVYAPPGDENDYYVFPDKHEAETYADADNLADPIPLYAARGNHE